MKSETNAPSSQPGAITECSSAIMPNATQLVELSDAEKLNRELQALAELDTDDLTEEIELQRIAKMYKARFKVIESSYRTRKAQILWAQKREKEIAREAEEAISNQAENAEIQRILQWLREQDSLVPTFHWALTGLGYLCEAELATTLLLSHGARLLPTSTAFFFFGASGSGKSDGVIQAAKMLPAEVYVSITSMSEQALNYMGDIKHKYLCLGEMTPQVDGQDDQRQMILRQLISENKITRGIVDRPDGQTNVYVEKVTEGPAVIVATTTKEPSKYNDELQNRAIWIPSPESQEVTRGVLRSIANAAKNPDSEPEMLTVTVKAFQQLQRELLPLKVIIPFSEQIIPKNDHITARRLSKLVNNYVRIHALLHQHLRERGTTQKGNPAVIATIADYEAAYRVLANGAPRVLEACCPAARKAFNDILRPALLNSQNKSLTTMQAKNLLQKPASTVHRWLDDYLKDGLLIAGGKDIRQNLFFLNAEAETTQDLGLIHPSSIV